MTDKDQCQHSSWKSVSGGKVACELCGAIGEERHYIKLDDPDLDLSDTFTRMFALAEHWMKRARAAEAIIGGRADYRNELPEPYAALAAAQEREAKLSGILATVAALFDEETGTIQLGRSLHEALVAAKAALSQSSHEQARQADVSDEPIDPIEKLVPELTADVQDYAEPPQLDPVHNALLHASSWIAHVPHGDNCFLMNEGEYNRCYCGRDALLGAINDALVIVESEDHKLVPVDPTAEMIHAGMRPGIGFYETGEITEEMADECYRAMIAAAPSGKEGE